MMKSRNSHSSISSSSYHAIQPMRLSAVTKCSAPNWCAQNAQQKSAEQLRTEAHLCEMLDDVSGAGDTASQLHGAAHLAHRERDLALLVAQQRVHCTAHVSRCDARLVQKIAHIRITQS